MLAEFEEIIFGISTKKDGPMKLANQKDDQATKNRQNFFSSQGIDNSKVVSAALANAFEVKIVELKDAGKMIPLVDALVTNQIGLVLAITVADCAPVYIYDPIQKVIALVHAGWRGVLGNIVTKTILLMKTNFFSKPENLQVFVGPHICTDHFEVQGDVAKMFADYEKYIIQQKGKIFIDLASIISSQLLNIGVLSNQVSFSKDCTYCEEKKYFSWRRDKPEKVEAMVVYLMMKH